MSILPRRAAIVAMLKAGHIVLECPLTDVQSTIKHQIKQSSSNVAQSTGLAALWSSFANWIPSSAIRFSDASLDVSADVSASVAHTAVPVVLGEYSPLTGEQALASAKLWNNAQIPTIVHFQEQDEVLGNAHDQEFVKALCASNGSAYTEGHVGNDGGHNSSFASFHVARNTFLRNQGGSYHMAFARARH